MTLPRGWLNASIGSICSLINGKAFKPIDWAKEGLPIIRIQNLNRADAPFNFCNEAVEPRYVVEPGELLFAWSGTPGTSFGAHVWRGPRAVLNQHIFRVRFDQTIVDRDYFRDAINSTLQELIGKAHGGVGLAHVTKGKFEATTVPLPPICEQRRIVEKLDTLTARLARARAELIRSERLAAQLRRQIHISILKTVSTCPQFCIGDICRVGTGATPKRDNATYYDGGTVPWVMSGTVNDDVVTKASDYITDTAIRETNCKIYAKGSLIVALYGEGKTRGKVATLGLAAATNQALAVLHDFKFDLVEVNWVKLYLHSRYEITREQAAGGVQPNLSLGIVKGIRVPLPGLALQRKLLKFSSDLEAKANRLEAEVARARALLDRLEAVILARAFRGELVPQDPDDEPASVMLDRIRARRAAAPKPLRRRRAAATSA